MKKIAIFKVGALGDVLMTTPFVRQLRLAFPEAQIDYWVGKSFSGALENNPHLSRIKQFDENIFFHPTLKKICALIAELKSEEYEAAFFLDKHWIFHLVGFFAGVPKRVGFWRDWPSRFLLHYRIAYGSPRHHASYYVSLLSFFLTPSYSDVDFDFSVGAAAMQEVDDLIKEKKLSHFQIWINSGGNNPGEKGQARRLPEALFVQLLKKTAPFGPIILLGDKKDGAYFESLKINQWAHNWAGKLSLQAAVELCRRAARVYTTDCGGMHLAAVSAKNIVSIFGPTNPEYIAPLRGGIEVIWRPTKNYNPYYQIRGALPAGNVYDSEKILSDFEHFLNSEKSSVLR